MEAPSDTKSSRFVSVKFDAVGRSRTFLLPDIDFAPQLEPGDPVVVQTGARKSYGAIVRSVPESAERKAPSAGSPIKVLRRATREDVVRKLRHEQREREAKRVCLLKIREQEERFFLQDVDLRFQNFTHVVGKNPGGKPHRNSFRTQHQQ